MKLFASGLIDIFASPFKQLPFKRLAGFIQNLEYFCRMNFLTDLLKKIGKMEKTITIFDTKIMHGRVGVVKNVKTPSLDGNF